MVDIAKILVDELKHTGIPEEIGELLGQGNKKPAAKKPAVKKTTAKKPAAKKAAAKKPAAKEKAQPLYDNPEEKQLLALCKKLSKKGRSQLVDYAKILAGHPSYNK